MMKIIDISIPITPDLPVWPGDPHVKMRSIGAIADGDEANVTEIHMCVHTGTHIDAPKHYYDDGKSIDQIPMNKIIGKALVVEIDPMINTITDTTLKNHSQWDAIVNARKVLFKTRNSNLWAQNNQTFHQDFVGIDRSGAEILAGIDLDLVGLDFLSIAPFNDSLRPHQLLLSRGVVLLEGVNLMHVQPGVYELFCLPLNIVGCEGSPARAILIAQA